MNMFLTVFTFLTILTPIFANAGDDYRVKANCEWLGVKKANAAVRKFGCESHGSLRWYEPRSSGLGAYFVFMTVEFQLFGCSKSHHKSFFHQDIVSWGRVGESSEDQCR